MILLASVLKPVDDPRMLGKFARTLAALGARVAVAGRAGAVAASSVPAGISQHPIFGGGRLSLGRLAAQARYWRLLGQLRPALVVVHAPELLPLTLLWQALGHKRQFIYDIRENYALNVSTQGVYRGLVQRTLASGLRWVEGLAARRAALTLAEASYAAELPFLQALSPSRVVVLENKYQPAPGEQLPTAPRPLPAPDEPLRLLYSGTISELNGLRAAVGLAKALHAGWPGGALLTIIGFCQRPEVLADLARWQAQGLPIKLIGGATAVPHAAIVAEIGRSHLGLALYEPHPSTWRCRPTKLFEYLAHGLPVLVPQNPLWEDIISEHDAGLSGDFSPTQLPATAAGLLAELCARAQNPAGGFYRYGLPVEAVLWAGEGKKLGLLLESLGLGPTFAAPFA